VSRVLPSGLIEGSPEADAAEAAESAAFEAKYGTTPRRPVAEPVGPTDAQRRLRSLGIDLRGTK